MSCEPTSLLVQGGADLLLESLGRYPDHYDDVVNDVHDRLIEQGYATKTDLAALIGWKHVRNARWMRGLLEMPETAVREATTAAFAPGLLDDARVALLRPLPGFGGGGAFTSVLLTAWDPTAFGVYDRFVNQKRPHVVAADCACEWTNLPTYWSHLRRLAVELNGTGGSWTPRMVEMAIMNV